MLYTFYSRKQRTDNNSFPKYDPYLKAKAQLYEKVINHNDLNGSIHLSTDGNSCLSKLLSLFRRGQL